MITPSEKEVIALRQEFELAMIHINMFDAQTLSSFHRFYEATVDKEGTPGYKALLPGLSNGENNLNSLFIGFCAGRGYNLNQALSGSH